jgi:hypothetical protein
VSRIKEKQIEDLRNLPDILYVKNTGEKVFILSCESTYYADRDEVKIIADIRFVSDNPSEYALRLVGAKGIAEPQPQMMYIGHPIPQMPTEMVWTARVDVKKCLSDIPFGTKAAEVLFGKK